MSRIAVRTFRAKDSGGPGFAVEFRVPQRSREDEPGDNPWVRDSATAPSVSIEAMVGTVWLTGR
jgi:hypothetical protein